MNCYSIFSRHFHKDIRISTSIRADKANSLTCIVILHYIPRKEGVYTCIYKIINIIDIELASPIVPGRLDIREDLRSSQRVEKFEVWCQSGGDWIQLASETVIGNRNIMLFESTRDFTVPETSLVRIVIKQSRWVPVLRSIQLYAA